MLVNVVDQNITTYTISAIVGVTLWPLCNITMIALSIMPWYSLHLDCWHLLPHLIDRAWATIKILYSASSYLRSIYVFYKQSRKCLSQHRSSQCIFLNHGCTEQMLCYLIPILCERTLYMFNSVIVVSIIISLINNYVILYTCFIWQVYLVLDRHHHRYYRPPPRHFLHSRLPHRLHFHPPLQSFLQYYSPPAY